MPQDALFTLAFALPPAVTTLSGRHLSTRRVILQKARDHPSAEALSGSHCMDAVGFRLSFTPLTGVLFTVPSRYCALSVTTSRLSWTVVSPASHGISRVPWYSRTLRCAQDDGVRDSHPLRWTIPGPSPAPLVTDDV